MSRMPLAFECQGKRLGATLDTAPGSTGLLLVSGGNETRAGAFNGQSRLAADIAAAGFPVFRFDRRGVGDSEGENREFRNSSRDIAAALDAFRAISPQVQRVVGFGNCDAASALMLARGAGCDALILSNPWTLDEIATNGAPAAATPASLRARYRRKLADPGEIWRLLTGRVDIKKLARGMAQAARPETSHSALASEMKAGLDGFSGPVTILLAGRDRTAQIFAERWDASDGRIARCEDASHAYVEPHARIWLRERILGALKG
ncbi:hydrolase 1, exosortase A system-associated [Qipengyuania zhejiangensis]|uniref:hydrolase 1, exosortase A system-associated n=1 Tax=Qipengyuania zhejiangensis TaxID=3077782 RepID=UPI002D7A2937|nr:hydrolase 1, exosortase A system-associated [Qipengyuania sp. Z2]